MAPAAEHATITTDEVETMATVNHRLAFERPIYELEARLQKLEAAGDESLAAREDIRRLKRELTETKKRIYGNLAPWETVQVARHSDRPMTTDYLDLVFDEFVELHGDKFFGDDRGPCAPASPSSTNTRSWSSAIKKARRSRSATPASSAAPIPRAIARRWPR